MGVKTTLLLMNWRNYENRRMVQEIFKLIEESKPENKDLLLLKWASVVSELGYEISFDD